MKITKEAWENGYPVNAIRFFSTYRQYMKDGVDEYGLGIANEHSFDVFKKISPETPIEIYEKYKKFREELRAYYNKHNTKWGFGEFGGKEDVES